MGYTIITENDFSNSPKIFFRPSTLVKVKIRSIKNRKEFTIVETDILNTEYEGGEYNFVFKNETTKLKNFIKQFSEDEKMSELIGVKFTGVAGPIVDRKNEQYQNLNNIKKD